MNPLLHIIQQAYVYCTDFVLELAHRTGTSYYEVNFFIFCVLWPLLTLLLGLNLLRLLRMYFKS
ncbi:MAG: hypothetical protein ACK4E8_11680 [Lacibacter sp.]|jgi:hypothetical protein